jgi:hypothetical protein
LDPVPLGLTFLTQAAVSESARQYAEAAVARQHKPSVCWISRGGEFWDIVALPFLGGARLGGKALDDLIVVEFAQMVSGPMRRKMFADMGAEVIKD